MNLYILVDWKNSERFFLEEELSSMGAECQVYDIPNYSMKDRTKRLRIFFLYFKYIQLAYRAIRYSKENDILICWNFTTSIAVGYLCKILNKRRIIIALNIIAHPRKGIIEKVRNLIFQSVMAMPSFHITVNSELYIEEYSSRFKVVKEKFHVLNDPIQSYGNILNYTSTKSFVFVGGEAQRDWETLFKASEYLPAISFVGIARKKNFNHTLHIPSNVRLFFDTDNKTFYDYMEHSSIVVIPLKSQLPSGLIVLLRAAMMQKPIIATNTPSIRNYINDEVNGLLIEQENPMDLAEKIQILYNDVDLQRKLSFNLLNYVLGNHSQKNYAKKLLEIILRIV